MNCFLYLGFVSWILKVIHVSVGRRIGQRKRLRPKKTLATKAQHSKVHTAYTAAICCLFESVILPALRCSLQGFQILYSSAPRRRDVMELKNQQSLEHRRRWPSRFGMSWELRIPEICLFGYWMKWMATAANLPSISWPSQEGLVQQTSKYNVRHCNKL